MDLSNQEKLMLFRRRNNLNQVKAADHFGVTPAVYRLWERTGAGAPSVKLGPIPNFEVCWILRVRENVSQESLAKAIGYCRWWVAQMEKGKIDAQPLKDYWQAAA